MAELFELVKNRTTKERDAREHIASILENPKEKPPIWEIDGLIANLTAEIKKYEMNGLTRERSYHALKRDRVACMILRVFPFRERQMCIMKYGEHLYFDSAGIACIRFEERDFKNWSSEVVKKGVNVQLEPERGEISEAIRDYIENSWPKMGLADTGLVFIPEKKMKSFNVDEGYYLSQRLRMITATFAPSKIPFECHAFRHIVATNHVHNPPPGEDGYEIAADALFDTVKMIRLHYGRKTSKDRARNVHRANANLKKRNEPTVVQAERTLERLTESLKRVEAERDEWKERALTAERQKDELIRTNTVLVNKLNHISPAV